MPDGIGPGDVNLYYRLVRGVMGLSSSFGTQPSPFGFPAPTPGTSTQGGGPGTPNRPGPRSGAYLPIGQYVPPQPGGGGGSGGGGGGGSSGGGGGTVADRAGQVGQYPYWLLARGPRTRGRKRKKRKINWRNAAAVLAARVLQTGEDVFGQLVKQPRAMPRPDDEFARLLKKVPSEFERILARTPDFNPGAARETAARAAARTVPVAGAVASILTGVLWPSSIGKEPPWSPPPAAPRPGPRTRPTPTRRPPIATLPSPQPAIPRPQPQTQTRPAPRPAPSRPVIPAPMPGQVTLPTPAPSPAPRPFALPDWAQFVIPFAFTNMGGRDRTRPTPRPTTWPRPLTGNQPRPLASPSGDSCNCQKPTRTKRERKDRCGNPIVRQRKSKRGGKTFITTTREIKCPA